MVIVVPLALFKPYNITDNFVNQAVLFVYMFRPHVPFPVPQPFRLT
jgi:hypothetical protein